MATPDLDKEPLEYRKTDGSLKSRLEMEEELRKKRKKVYSLRILAIYDLGLDKIKSFDMKEAVLRHWCLDELIRRGAITGDLAGVNVQTYNDDNENRQFTQRLIALIQTGQALTPKEGEGVDMSNIPQPPPGPVGAPPNGQPQQGFVPPPPPVGVGVPAPQQGFVPSIPGAFQPQPGFAAPVSPQMQQGFGPPQGFAAPQQFVPPQPGAFQPPGMPQAASGQPMMPPGYIQPQAAPPQAAQPAQGGGRRRKGAGAGGGQQAAPPPATPVPPVGLPQGFAPPPSIQAPMPQQGFAPLPQGVPQAQPAQQQVAQLSDTAALQGQIAELNGIVRQQSATMISLLRQVQLSNMALTVLSRAVYQKQGSADLEGWLKELGVSLPQ